LTAPVPPLETERLLLKPLELTDAAAIQQLFPQWEIVRFMGAAVPWPYPADGALTYIRDVALPAMARGTEWHWTLRRRAAPGELIGMISLMAAENNNRGFWVGLPWQRQGFATEASRRVTDYWFDVLGRPVLRAPKAIANTASRRISEQSAMRVVARETRHMVSGPQPGEIWEITREQWRRYRGGW